MQQLFQLNCINTRTMNRLEAITKLLLKANIFFTVCRLSLDYHLNQLYTSSAIYRRTSLQKQIPFGRSLFSSLINTKLVH